MPSKFSVPYTKETESSFLYNKAAYLGADDFSLTKAAAFTILTDNKKNTMNAL